jgi:hypothetical protein
MSEPLYPLGHEIAKTQAELVTFRDEYLPVLLSRELPDSMPYSTVDFDLARPHTMENLHPISAWRDAVAKLSYALPLPNDATVLNAKDFKEFMFCEGTPAYSLLNNDIRWKIGLFCSMDTVFLRAYVPPCLEKKGDLNENDFWAALPEIKAWLLSLDAKNTALMNALCMVLPFIADVDPPFARKALDLDTWQDVNGFFRHVVNNALLHVLGALANNHFTLIRDYLEHPCLYGGYTWLMPHYLFAVLFQKVSILRQLTSDQTRRPDAGETIAQPRRHGAD